MAGTCSCWCPALGRNACEYHFPDAGQQQPGRNSRQIPRPLKHSPIRGRAIPKAGRPQKTFTTLKEQTHCYRFKNHPFSQLETSSNGMIKIRKYFIVIRHLNILLKESNSRTIIDRTLNSINLFFSIISMCKRTQN